MNIDKVIIVDIESNGLLRESDKIHVVSMAYQKEGGEWTTSSTNDYDKMRKLFTNPNHTIVGHNFICFDIPVIEKVLGIEFKCHVIDTLGLSWALYPWRTVHGLAKYGEEVGIAKPEVEDELWKGLSEEDLALPPEQVKLKWEEHYQIMKHRCEEDCKINVAVWLKFKHKLSSLYSGDIPLIIRYIKYINFKMELLREQEKNMLKVDVKKLEENITLFETMKEEKVKAIMPHMPKVAVTSIKKRPAKPFKKDGSLSKTGENWFNLLNELDLPEDYTGEVKVINKYIDPNPNSHSQVKDWLLGLGWEPKEFKDSTSTDPSREGEKIPQVRIDGMLCESVLKLKEVSEGIEHLDGLSILTHRLGALNSIKNNLIDGEYVVARASGLTNTLRFRHAAPIVNLNSVTSPNDFEGERDIRDGRYIRELFIPHEGCVFFGSDLASLEDRFKQHQIRDLDPDFVEEMNVEGFDPHLDLAVLAGVITKEEAEAHKRKEIDLSEIRNMYKSGNYACVPVDSTEVLSKEGWKFYKDLREGELIMTYNAEKDITEFSKLEKLHFFENRVVTELSNDRWKMESTPDHRWIGSSRVRKKSQQTKFIKSFKTTHEINQGFNIINASKFVGGDWDISEDESSLLAWILADGYYKWSDLPVGPASSFGKKRGLVCSIAQSKKKFYLEIKDLLGRLNLDFYEYTNNSGTEIFSLRAESARYFFRKLGLGELGKHETDWSSLILRMSPPALNSFFSSFLKADGNTTNSRPTKKSLIIYQNEGPIMDAVMLCGFLLGMRVTFNRRGESKCFDIRFSKSATTSGQRLLKNETRKTDVFCVTTPNSTFVIRQGGTMTITGNCQYGVGKVTLSKAIGKSQKEAQKVIDAYWERNWAIKVFAEAQKVVNYEEEMWIINPVNNFRYSLRSDKDRFSTLTQGGSTYVFDLWAKFLMDEQVKIGLNVHDEVGSGSIKKGDEERVRTLCKDKIDLVTKILKLKRDMDCDTQFSTCYANVH